jgi:cobalt-precorrin 5A hydrolase
MSTDSNDTDTSESGGSHCSTPDSDGEVAEEIAIISFERKLPVAEDIEEELADDYETIDIIE